MQADLIILGGGPAGLTAGLYASRARINVILLEKGLPGGQLAATELVDNYPGQPEPILGFELAQKMESQARRFGLEIQTADIVSISRTDAGFDLKNEEGTAYSCRALIVATGANPIKPGIPGELQFAGRGVSYCAVCDGPFFRDVEVAVIGGGDSAVEEAVYLARFASKVHLVHRRDKLRAVKEIQEKAFAEPKMVIHWNSVPEEIIGEFDVKTLRIRSTLDGSISELQVGGVFFYVGIKPTNEAFNGLVNADERGFVLTDENMATSVPGVFAAGDVRVKVLRQISTAVGDGAIAAYSAQHYLESA
ncbi:MAG: thioredoxin-disulfide reductase [Deltaproteobacteria bacterium]|nr:thioredoxin-disulfide reductase [Deltaproteobacteria bacterium]